MSEHSCKKCPSFLFKASDGHGVLLIRAANIGEAAAIITKYDIRVAEVYPKDHWLAGSPLPGQENS